MKKAPIAHLKAPVYFWTDTNVGWRSTYATGGGVKIPLKRRESDYTFEVRMVH